MRDKEKELCPCCGQAKVGWFEPCPVCDWWNDFAQEDDPDWAGGENAISLNEAKKAWKERNGHLKPSVA